MMNIRYPLMPVLILSLSMGGVSRVAGQCAGSGSPLVEITCTGTSEADVFEFAVDTEGFVKINGVDPANGPFAASAVNEITVNGNDEDDLIDLSAVDPLVFLELTTVWLDGGDGDDDIIGSLTGDFIIGGAGCDFIKGLGGDDKITDNIATSCGWGCALGGDGHDEYRIATAVSPDLLLCGFPGPPPPVECPGFTLPATCSSNASGAVHHYEGFECLQATTGSSDDQITVSVQGAGVEMMHVTPGEGNDEVALILDELLGNIVNISHKGENTEVSVETEELFFFAEIRRLVGGLGVGFESGPGASAKTMTADDHFFTTGLPGVQQFLLGGGGNDTLTVDTLGLGAQASTGQILFDEAAPISYAEFEDVDLVSNPTLPVELTSFDAVTDNDLVRLSWTTATEENNAGFEIEQRFESGFETIGFVAGHGTTEQPSVYTYLVQGLAPGRYEFRLRQIDFDGSFSLSDAVEATIEIPGSHWVAPAYPNPFSSTTELRLSVPTTQSVSVVLYDAIGRPVQSIFDGTLQGGSPLELSINGEELMPGVYFARIQGVSFSVTERVLRIR